MDSNSRSCDCPDVIIAAGGKALALPGVLDAQFYAACVRESKPQVSVIGVGLGEEGSEALEAARLSMKQLPGEPVVMDDVHGEPYMGVPGLRRALLQAISGELPPRRPRIAKPAQLDVDLWGDDTTP